MSYVVFALKWRPNNFDEIVGQDNVVATLKNAIRDNRLAHAYLFSGPRGVGKTSTARILAKALNCKDGPTPTPCSKCPACKEISRGNSLDVIEIDGASNRGIDEIRALRENVKFAPAQRKYKVYIIDEVHQITSEGFNALLKTLEEPPPFVIFIFATTHPHKVIPTILSRCQRLDFRRISVREIIAQLQMIVKAEKINVDKEVLTAIASSSDGSLRDAESILDQLISFAKDNISLKDAVSMLGWVEQEALFNITDKIIAKDAHAALALFNEIINQGKDIHNLLTNLIEHFRNLMIAKVTSADSQLIDLPEDICERLLKQSKAFGLEEIFHTFSVLVNTQEVSKRLDSLRIPLEITLVKLANDKKSVTTGNPISREADEKEDAQTQAHPDPPNSIPLEDIESAWQGIIDSLASVKVYVANYFGEGHPVKLANNVLTVAFPVNCSLHKESLEHKENRVIIEKALADLFKADLKVNFILSKEVSHKKKDGHSDTFVKSALDIFNGRVIKEE